MIGSPVFDQRAGARGELESGGWERARIRLGARSCNVHTTQLQLIQVLTKLHRTHGRASNKCAQFITARHSRPVETSLARLTSKIPGAGAELA